MCLLCYYCRPVKLHAKRVIGRWCLQNDRCLVCSRRVIKCESAKLTTHKMRKIDVKNFAFYTLPLERSPTTTQEYCCPIWNPHYIKADAIHTASFARSRVYSHSR